MHATQPLRDEHATLRAKLALLQAWLSSAIPNPADIHRLAVSIAGHLRRHTQHEEKWLYRCRAISDEPSPEAWSQIVAVHELQRQIVAALLELFLKSLEEPGGSLTCCGTNFVSGLLEQMASEEHELFPLLEAAPLRQPAPLSSSEQTIKETPLGRAACPISPERESRLITTIMTVDEVLQVYPHMRRIFEMFAVDPEGDCRCRLDGLGWRRNVDVRALLDALNRSRADPGLVRLPEMLWESCDGMMLLDTSRRILAMNRALERLTGWRAREVLGRHECGLFFQCEDVHGCSLTEHPEKCPALKAMKRGRPMAAVEYTIRTRVGRRVLVSASYTPVHVATGAVYTMAIMRDMSRQQRWRRRMIQQARLDKVKGAGGDRIIGLPAPTERRRFPRIAVEAPMLLRRWNATPELIPCKATTLNVSMVGACCRIGAGAAVIVGQDVGWSITIPQADQQRIGYAQLAGRGRVVRADDASASIESDAVRALGIAFLDYVTVLQSASRNGSAHEPEPLSASSEVTSG